MSLTYDTLNSITRELAIVTQDNVLTSIPLVKYLTQHKLGQVDGQYIEALTRYAVPNLTVWDGDADLVPAETETTTKARYSWAYAYTAQTISRNHWLAAKQKGERAIIGLAKDKMQAMEDGIKLGLDDELFTEYDTPTHTFNSLVDIVKATDPTHQASGLGGIKISEAPWWEANVLAYDDSKGDIRWHMQKMLRLCSRIGTKPDLIMTTGDIIDLYGDEIYSKEGILSQKSIEWGFPNVIPFAGGIPVTDDDNATSGCMYFLNSNYLSLVVHPDDFFQVSDWRETSTTDLNLIAHITLTAQLITSARRGLGIITGIS